MRDLRREQPVIVVHRRLKLEHALHQQMTDRLTARNRLLNDISLVAAERKDQRLRAVIA